jgi:hypothetical protein
MTGGLLQSLSKARAFCQIAQNHLFFRHFLTFGAEPLIMREVGTGRLASKRSRTTTTMRVDKVVVNSRPKVLKNTGYIAHFYAMTAVNSLAACDRWALLNILTKWACPSRLI